MLQAFALALILLVALLEVLLLGHCQQRLGIGILDCLPLWSPAELQQDRDLLFRSPGLQPLRGAVNREAFSPRVLRFQRLTFSDRRLSSDEFTICK
jgi:hypothetical protein